MAIAVACSHCGKTYNVPPETAGKKVRCKACGQIFVATAAASGGSANVYAGLGSSSQPATGGKSRLKGLSEPPPMDLGLAPPTTPAPAAYPAPAYGQPPAGVRQLTYDPPCPSCQRPLPLTQRVCTSCGYDRQTGQRITPPASVYGIPPGGMVDCQRVEDERDRLGVRICKEFANEGLSVLETIWVRSSFVIFLAFTVFTAIFPIAIGIKADAPGEAYGKLIGLSFFVVLALLAGIGIVSGGCILGLKLGAKIMKHELPESLFGRWTAIALAGFVIFVAYGLVRGLASGLPGTDGLLGMFLSISLLYSFWLTWLADVIALTIAFAGNAPARGFGRPPGPAGMVPAADAVASLLVILFACGAMFGATWFLTRTKAIEVLVDFVMMIVGFVVASLVAGPIIYVIGWLAFKALVG